MKRIVIVGGGTAGTMMANKLSRALDGRGWVITVIDRDNNHIYQPGLLFVPFGLDGERDLVRPRLRLLEPGVELVLSQVEQIEPDSRRVALANGMRIPYDLLILATGTRILPEETPGLLGPGWRRDIFDFYTLEGARALHANLERFEGGRIVLNVVGMPIKCPVAPLEFLFLADAWATERGIRNKVELTYATPLDAAFTKPRAAAALGDLLERKNVRVVSDFSASEADPEGKVLRSYDGRELDYDLLVTIPLHGGDAAIARSGLGDDLGFVPTHPNTLQATEVENTFALGDATNLPTSKAGAVAHFEAEVLVENVLRHIDGLPPEAAFDGHANCFIETGHGKAILIDFNYDTEPLPGRFPIPGVGPFTLLEESHINHWGKLAFRWAYWNLLVKGEELPLDHRMAMAGKWS